MSEQIIKRRKVTDVQTPLYERAKRAIREAKEESIDGLSMDELRQIAADHSLEDMAIEIRLRAEREYVEVKKVFDEYVR